MGDASRPSPTWRRQRAFALALAGRGSAEIAVELGVSQRQAQRLLAAMRDDLLAARAEQLQRVRAAVLDEAEAAVAALRDVMQAPDTPPAVRVQAALGLLAQLRGYHELAHTETVIDELRERVAALEQRVSGGVIWPRGDSSNGTSKVSRRVLRQPRRS